MGLEERSFGGRTLDPAQDGEISNKAMERWDEWRVRQGNDRRRRHEDEGKEGGDRERRQTAFEMQSGCEDMEKDAWRGRAKMYGYGSVSADWFRLGPVRIKRCSIVIDFKIWEQHSF